MIGWISTRSTSLLQSQLRRNLASGSVTTLLNSALTLTSYPIYLHYLGYELYGTWLILATFLTFAQLGTLGVNTALTQLVALEHARTNNRAVLEYLFCTLAFLAISGSSILGLLHLFPGNLIAVTRITGADRDLATGLLPFIGILSLYTFIVEAFTATLSGIGRIDLVNYFQLGSQIVSLLLAWLLLNLRYGVLSLVVANAASRILLHLAVCIVLVFTFSLRDLPQSLKWHRLQTLFGFGSTVFVGSLLNLFLTPFNRFIIARYVGLASVPVFEIGLNTAMGVRGLFESAFRALAPEVTRLSNNSAGSEHGDARIRSLKARAEKLIIMFGLPVYLLVIVLAFPIMSRWLGSRYRGEQTTVLRILLAGTFLSLLGSPSYYLLIGLRRGRSILLCFLLQSGTNVMIIILLYLSFGALSLISISGGVAGGMGVASLYLVTRTYSRPPPERVKH